MKWNLNRMGLSVVCLSLLSAGAAAKEFAVPCDAGYATESGSAAVSTGKAQDRWRYPYEARKHRDEGTVVLQVELDAAGATRQVAVARSSGSSALDRAALKAAKSERFCRLDAPTEAISGLADVAVTYSLSAAVARL
jgi:TonB family protein